MVVDKRSFQLQQMLNLVSQQKWEQVSSRFVGEKIECKIRRKFTDEEAPIKQFEVDKMNNLVRTFGWTAESTSIEDGMVIVDLAKTLEAEVSL
jgi:hypothetical protein